MDGVSDPVAMAAMNNVLQSEAVLAAAGSAGSFSDAFWTNQHTFDVPYANGATLGAAASIRSHQAAIERLTASRSPETPTHVMDSWAALDLSPLGYRARLADEWFVRDGPVEQTPPDAAENVEVIRSARGLAEFESAGVIGFGGNPPDIPGHTYPASLLADGRFTFFGRRFEGALASGVFLFRDPECVGVFTFFTLPAHRGRGLGTALLQRALSQAPDMPIATNPSSMSRGIFARLGFRAVGERIIWRRSK